MKKKTKIVLIDYNEVFRTLMISFAESRGLDLACYGSVIEMGSISSFKDFDIAIVESDKGTLTGIEVGEYLNALLKNMPLILISCGLTPTRATEGAWPSSVRGYVHKNEGPDAIFDSALRFCDLAS